MAKAKLIVFDVEGVLIPKNRFFFDIGKILGWYTLMSILFFGALYGSGLISLESAMKRVSSTMKGLPLEKVLEWFTRIPVTPNAKNVFEQLKLRGHKIALISSGVPTFLVSNLANLLGADYAFGVDVGIADGKLTGEVSGDAIKASGKLKILTSLLQKEQFSLSDCVVVADDRNNLCIMLPEVQKIGFNPDFLVRIKSDFIINNKIQNVLTLMEGKQVKRSFPSQKDLVRENIHASAIFVPVIAQLITVSVMVILIIAVSAVYAVSELMRLNGKDLPVISTITRHAAFSSELRSFAAAPLYYAFGIVLTLLLFPFPASAAAIAIFALGDSTASIFGGLWGKRLPFNKAKTLEGSLAGFFFGFLAGCFFITPLLALVGAAVAMFIEYLPLPINDNITIPIITGLTLTLLLPFFL
jgi:HAD superfamily phosphoserine phosphatase-like hydrolase